jgi:hypothetical protein
VPGHSCGRALEKKKKKKKKKKNKKKKKKKKKKEEEEIKTRRSRAPNFHMGRKRKCGESNLIQQKVARICEDVQES